MRRATVAWMRLSSTTWTSPFAVSGVGARSARGRLAPRAAGRALACCRRLPRRRPSRSARPGPEPWSCSSSTFSSRAMRRATGDAFTRPSPSADGAGAAALLRSAGAVAEVRLRRGCLLRPLLACARFAGLPADGPSSSPGAPMRAIGSPIGSVDPSSREDLEQRPRRWPRRSCSPCRSRSRPARRRASPRRRPTSASAGRCPPPWSRTSRGMVTSVAISRVRSRSRSRRNAGSANVRNCDTATRRLETSPAPPSRRAPRAASRPARAPSSTASARPRR